MKSDKKQRFHEDLRQGILTLDFPPGSALDEAGLSATYGLSRTPLREVFQQLAGEGYLTLAPNRGATVSAMDIKVMRTFFQTAPMIYAAVGRLAAENRTSFQLTSLKEIQDGFRVAVDGQHTRDAAMFNHRFHETIGDMADNPYLMASLNRLLIDHTRMSQTFYQARAMVDQKRIKKACEQHDAMIEAIEAGEPSRAVELTLEHWDLSRGQIEKYVQPAPLPVEGITTDRERHRHAV